MSRSFRRAIAQRLIEIAALAGCNSSPCGKPIDDPHQVCVDPVGTIDAGTSGVDAGVDPNAACPTGDALDEAIGHIVGPGRFSDVESGPTRENGGQCCYTIQDHLVCTGRPFVVDHQPITAPVRAGNDGWADVLAPRLDHLSAMDAPSSRRHG